MIRTLRKYTLLLSLLILSTLVAVGQNEGVEQPKENAIDLAFQYPSIWSGNKYTTAATFWERSYALVGVGSDAIWGMDELFDGSTTGFYSTLGFGHWVAPVHGYEVGFSYGLLPIIDWGVTRMDTNYYSDSHLKYFNFHGSYLFNISNFATRSESDRRLNWLVSGGIDLSFQKSVAVGFHTSMRCQYSLTPEIGFYIEPMLGAYSNSLDNESISASSLHLLPSISAGLTIKLERSEGFRREKYVDSRSRVRAVVEKRDSSERGAVTKFIDRTFGYRLNSEILSDSIFVDIVETEEVEDVEPIDWYYEFFDKHYMPDNGRLALTTNLFYWGLSMPNIGVEYFMGRHLSASLSYVCPWFTNRAAGFSYRMINLEADCRYWIQGASRVRGGNMMRGLYGGLYGSIGYYDYSEGDIGYMGRKLYNAGVSGGYALPLGRTISLDMSVGFGLISTSYDKYEIDDSCLIYQSTHSFSLMGPTRLMVGLSWAPHFDYKGIKHLFNKTNKADKTSKANKASKKFSSNEADITM